MSNTLSIHIDGLRTESEMNRRDHWRTRDNRRKVQKKAVYYAWKATAFGKSVPKLPVVVRLTRFGPRLLDDDNLRGALKFCRDTVAELLNVDDGSEQIKFEYGQQHDADYAVTIQVEAK